MMLSTECGRVECGWWPTKQIVFCWGQRLLRDAIGGRDTSALPDKSRHLVAVDQSKEYAQRSQPSAPWDSRPHEFSTLNTPLNHSVVADSQTRLCRGQAPLVRHRWSIASDRCIRGGVDRLFSSDPGLICSFCIAAVAMRLVCRSVFASVLYRSSILSCFEISAEPTVWSL